MAEYMPSLTFGGARPYQWRRQTYGSKMKTILLCAALIGGLSLATQSQAQDAPDRVRVGTLSCHESSGWGFIFGSSHDVRCTFVHGDHVEHYDGSISKFGVDIGYQQSGVLIWEVVAPSDHPNHGALDGHYGGLTAGATVGVGLDANALVGGSGQTISLQPLSIEGDTGLNIAAGVGEMSLHSHSGV